MGRMVIATIAPSPIGGTAIQQTPAWQATLPIALSTIKIKTHATLVPAANILF